MRVHIMPFGLKNAGATYQRLMTKIFKPLIGRSVEVYIDDIVVKIKTREEHVLHLQEVFHLLRKYGMKLNPSKCAFGVSAGKFLGFMVSQRGIEVCPDQVKAVMETPPPEKALETKYQLSVAKQLAQQTNNKPQSKHNEEKTRIAHVPSVNWKNRVENRNAVTITTRILPAENPRASLENEDTQKVEEKALTGEKHRRKNAK